MKAFAIDSGLDSLLPLPLPQSPSLQQLLVQQLGISRDSVGWPLLPFNCYYSKYSSIPTKEFLLPGQGKSGGGLSCHPADQYLPWASQGFPQGHLVLLIGSGGWLARGRV